VGVGDSSLGQVGGGDDGPVYVGGGEK